MSADADLARWYQLQAQLAQVKAEEMVLRKRLFGNYFPAPREGTNNLTLPDGAVLKGDHKISRDIDQALLQVNGPALVEEGIPVGKLVQWQPSLVMKEYRELEEKQRLRFDICLTIKPGSPTLQIAIPKVKK